MSEETRRSSDGEGRDLELLSRELPPPPQIEDHLVATLRREGLVAFPNGERRWLPLAASFVSLAVGLAGGWLLSSHGTGAEPPAPGYLLALYAAPGPPEDTEEHRLAAEYGAWARQRAADGELLAGEPLAERGWLLSATEPEPRPATLPGAEASQLVGYFLLRDVEIERALEIAAECPHLRHGGSVVVRPIRR